MNDDDSNGSHDREIDNDDDDDDDNDDDDIETSSILAYIYRMHNIRIYIRYIQLCIDVIVITCHTYLEAMEAFKCFAARDA